MTALAVLMRVVVMRVTPASAPISDMAEYWIRAVHLYEHGALYPDSWRMPGLPLWLAGAFSLGGVTVDTARAANVVAGSAATALTFMLACRIGTLGRAVVAGAIVALYPTLLLYTSLVATETLVAVPLVAALLAATYPTRGGALVMGAATAAALLVRPASVALVPAAIAALLFSPPHDFGSGHGSPGSRSSRRRSSSSWARGGFTATD